MPRSRTSSNPSLMYFTPLEQRRDVTSRVEYTCRTPSSGGVNRAYTLYVQPVDGRMDAFWCSCPGFVNRRYCKHNTELKNRLANGTVRWATPGALGFSVGGIPPVVEPVRTEPPIQARIGDPRPAGRMDCDLPGCCAPVEQVPATVPSGRIQVEAEIRTGRIRTLREITFGMDGRVVGGE